MSWLIAVQPQREQVALQTRDNVVYRRVVSLHFMAENPTVAAAGANAWAEAARDFAAGRRENRCQDLKNGAAS